MGEVSGEVPVRSPVCYTIEDDDEPEVIFISDNNGMLEEDSRDGEPSSTTSDLNGDDDGAKVAGDDDEIENIVEGVQNNISKRESSDSSDDEEGSGNVLNDFIKLIDLVKSYEKVDKTVKTKFKDGFLFLENLQTQFEDTENNINEKDEIIAELIAENNRLKGDNKQLKGEFSTQSLQFGMLRNRYVKLDEEIERLKICKKATVQETPVVPMPINLSLEKMKSKADKLQQQFRQLCIKMSEETVIKSDPESVKKSKELKSFQNEVGVLFIKVQHKLSKWVKNQVKMEEELERARMSLEQLHEMVTESDTLLPVTEETMKATVTSDSQLETVTPSVTVVEPPGSQLISKKRKLPALPPLVPINIPTPSVSKSNSEALFITAPEQNTIPAVPVPHELSNSSPQSSLEPGTSSDVNVVTQFQLMDINTLPAVPLKPSTPLVAPIQLSPPIPAPMKSSPALSKTRITDTSRISPPSHSPIKFKLAPLQPPKPIVFTPTSSSSKRVASDAFQTQAPQVQPPPPPVKRRRRRAKTLRTYPPPHLPQMTSVESKYPFTPPQYSQAPYPVHPQYNPYSVSQRTPTGPHQATLQAYQNQMMQLSYPTTPQSLPQQQHQISSSSVPPPVPTQNKISPASTSAPETPKQSTSVTFQNKCQVCGMTFSTPIQLKLHHAVVHSNKTPSSAFTGPPSTLSPTSASSSSSSHQQNLRSLLVPPPPLQERHQNASSLQRVSTIVQPEVSTNMNITSITPAPPNESINKRRCTGLSPLATTIPANSAPKSSQIAPVSINQNIVTNSVNSTHPSYDSNLFSWLDLL